MAKFKQLHDLYRFSGFVPHPKVQGVFGDSRAVLITLQRRRKKRCAASAVRNTASTTTNDHDEPGISPVATSASTSASFSAESSALGVEA
jgi:hypothetical protein